MKPIARVLVPVDFSACSDRAVTVAADLAKRLGASFDLLHVWHPSTVPAAQMVAAAYLDAEAREMAKAALTRVATHIAAGGSPAANVYFTVGAAAAEILAVAEREPYGLIVMGTHGRGAVSRFFLGSVAAQVMRRAPCPVLTVQEPALAPDATDRTSATEVSSQPAADRERLRTESTQRIGNVLVATDFTPQSRDAALRAAQLPLSAGSSITLLHVLRPADFRGDVEPRLRAAAELLMRGERAALEAQLGKLRVKDVDVFDVIEVGRPHERIAARARHERAQLVVIGRGARHGLAERLLGSTGERVVRSLATSVLIVARTPDGPYRRPLLAVDMTEASSRARQWTLRVCEPQGPIPAVHAHEAAYVTIWRDSGMTEANIERYVAQEEAAAAARLEHWQQAEQASEHELDCVLLRGSPRRVILEEAGRRAADLIAIGAGNASRIGELFIGSVAESIARRADCDVLVAR